MKILLLLLFLSFPAFGQINAKTEDGKKVILKEDGTWTFAPNADKNAPAIVYIYRLKEGGIYNRARSVFVDGKEAFDIKQGDFVGVCLAPGLHKFKTNKDDSEITIDVQGGERYFALLSVSAAGFAQTHIFTETPESQAVLQLKKTVPVDEKQIKVKDLDYVKEKPE